MLEPLKFSENEYFAVVQQLLAENKKKKAARLLWPWITQNYQSDMIWDELESNQYLAIMGHGSASKTFTCAQWFLLDWWTAPHQTALIVTSDTVPSMRRRVWSDLKMLFSKSKISIMPGRIVDSKGMIIYSKEDEKNAIHAIAAESDDAQSKIQGLHTKRVRVLVDEADNEKSRSIWSAIANLSTSGEIKVCALANPENRYSDFGQHVEPENGWTSVSPEADFAWRSKVGYRVVRLDGLKSPNIVSKKDDFPFLLTNSSVDEIIEKYGVNSKEWWKYVRAWYPMEDTASLIYPFDLVEKARNNMITWYSSVQGVSSCDPAFEGGDACIQSFGQFGRLADSAHKTGLLVQEFVTIKRKDANKELHIDFADQIIDNCKQRGISPFYFVLDATGNASFMAAYIKTVWSKEILAVQFADSASDKRIFQEDAQPCNERFDRFVTELWFAGRDWMKAGLVQLRSCPNQLSIDLTSRKYRLKGKGISSAESKLEMKARGLKSPDYGDAFNLMVHILRYRANLQMPSVTGKDLKNDPMAKFRKKTFSFTTAYGKSTTGHE